jgi:molybdopterin/thiamine biosynthesis adenylyltransferase
MLAPMQLSEEELERYARHIVLAEIGGPGQQRLKRARVLAVGAGGLGTPVLQYLAAAGVGTLGIADDDTVSLSNLQRQVIHDTDRIGQKKVDSAAVAIHRINPHVEVERYPLRITQDNAPGLVCGFDVIVDGSDNFATRYAVADACAAWRRPLVSAAVGRFDGSITTLVPYDKTAEGRRNPSYRDLFPTPPPDGTLPTCAEAGILGALTGVVGSMMALEAIKLIAGVGEPLIGRLMLFDGLSMRVETVNYGRAG